MFVHTVIMVIEPHMKQGRQHKLISTIFLATSVTKKLDHNTDEAVTLLETTGTYSDTITLPDGGNYIGIECEDFTGKTY